MKFFSAAAVATMVLFSSVAAHPVGAEEVEILGKTEASFDQIATIAQLDSFDSCTKQTNEEECKHADPGLFHKCDWQAHCDTFQCVLVKRKQKNCEKIKGEGDCNHEDDCVWLERFGDGDRGVCDKIKDQVDQCSSRITDKEKCNSILGCAWLKGSKNRGVCGHAPRQLQCVSQRLNTVEDCRRAGCSWKWDDADAREEGGKRGNCIGRWERKVFKALQGFPSDEAKSVIKRIFRGELYRFKEEQWRRDGHDLIKFILDKDNCLKRAPAFEDIE